MDIISRVRANHNHNLIQEVKGKEHFFGRVKTTKVYNYNTDLSQIDYTKEIDLLIAEMLSRPKDMDMTDAG